MTVLLLLPAEAAAGRDIRTFEGGYLADDRPVTALVRNAGRYADQITEHGIAGFSVQLGGPARRPGSPPAEDLITRAAGCGCRPAGGDGIRW